MMHQHTNVLSLTKTLRLSNSKIIAGKVALSFLLVALYGCVEPCAGEYVTDVRRRLPCLTSCRCGKATTQEMPYPTVCDLCEKHIPKGTSVPSCRDCHWDICMDCAIDNDAHRETQSGAGDADAEPYGGALSGVLVDASKLVPVHGQVEELPRDETEALLAAKYKTALEGAVRAHDSLVRGLFNVITSTSDYNDFIQYEKEKVSKDLEKYNKELVDHETVLKSIMSEVQNSDFLDLVHAMINEHITSKNEERRSTSGTSADVADMTIHFLEAEKAPHRYREIYLRKAMRLINDASGRLEYFPTIHGVW